MAEGHEHNHDHNHNHEGEEMDWVELVDNEGATHRFLIDSVLDLDEHRYAILLPEDQMEADEPELVVFRIETDEKGQDVLVDIDDEDEFERVCEALDMEDDEAEEEDEE